MYQQSVPPRDTATVKRPDATKTRRKLLTGVFQGTQERTFLAGPQISYNTIAPPSAWQDARLRLLRRATMGVTAADIAEVQASGYQQWLNRQVNYTRIDDTATEAYVAAKWPFLAMSAADLFNQNGGQVQTQLQEATIYRAAFSTRQLYERMVEFWSDHFNISMQKVGYLKALDDRDVIRTHALGKFSDLLYASAHSPAMLAYLDQNLSRRGSPNQNYAREVMELHTLGVNGGYTQDDVAEMSRVLTGWTFTGQGEFRFDPNRHDWGEKTVLGVTIPASSQSAGAAGQQEGEQMLDLLAHHESTSYFIATKLLKWLVTPDPTLTQIKAVAGVFRATKGDIKLVVRSALNEGWVAASPVKLKRPFHLVVSAMRAANPAVVTPSPMNSQLNAIGQSLFQYETPDGYPDAVEYWSGNLVPRWNFGTTFANQNSDTTMRVDVTPLLAGSPDAVIDWIQADFFAGELSLATRTALTDYLKGGTFNSSRVRETIALALSTQEFQWY